MNFQLKDDTDPMIVNVNVMKLNDLVAKGSILMTSQEQIQKAFDSLFEDLKEVRQDNKYFRLYNMSEIRLVSLCYKNPFT